MANVLNQRTIILDTEGIISTTPIWVRKVIIHPNSAGDSATFQFWHESDTATSSKPHKSISVTASTNTFSSTGNFPTATINPSQIFKVTYSSSGNNAYTYQIATNADDNTITTDATNSIHGTVVDDATKVYSWKVWTPYTAFKIISPGTEVIDWALDFGDKGRWFPNLSMAELSASATFELFVK